MRISHRRVGKFRAGFFHGANGAHDRIAFSLIELLMVIGIISILSAIALSNYQDALVRSKIAKFMGDGRAMGHEARGEWRETPNV